MPEGDLGVDGISYRIFFDAHQPLPNVADAARSALVGQSGELRCIGVHRRSTLHSGQAYCEM